MSDILAATWDVPSVEIDWSLLGNVYAIANGKGGVGKTSSACHLGGLTAKDGVRTLVIDLNGQGNVSLALGIKGQQGVDDAGKSLYLAITAGEALRPVNVRPNLDVVPGGEWVRRIAGAMAGEMSDETRRRNALLALARAIQDLAGDYNIIIIDCPPENPPLLQLALCAARFVLVPMKTDNASRDGLREIAKEFRSMRAHNPYLLLLGVYLFASQSSSKNIRQELRDNVSNDLGDASLVFSTYIRHAEGVARDVFKFGRLAFELEEQITNNPRLVRSRSSSDVTVSGAAAGVSQDYDNLAREVLTRAAERRDQLIEEGIWP